MRDVRPMGKFILKDFKDKKKWDNLGKNKKSESKKDIK